MAYGAAQGLSDPIEDYASYWLKFYVQGTVTPLSMATDSAAGTLLAKAEISSGGTVPIGFIKTAGDVIFIPYLNAAYDGWLFPTAAEADANDTTNAVQIADNIDLIEFDGSSSVGYTAPFTGAVLSDVQTKLSERLSVADFGGLPSATAAANDTAFAAAAAALAAGGQFIIPAGTYSLSDTITFPLVPQIIGEGSVKLDFTMAGTEHALDIPWGAGKPAHASIKNINIYMNDTGNDGIVMRGINCVMDEVYIKDAGRDSLRWVTSASTSEQIENFYMNKVELDGAGRNCLSFELALKSAGSFINEGIIIGLECREAGKNGTGTEIKFIVPENTYPACKIAGITFLTGNMDQRSASRTEPYCIMVDRASGVTNGATVEQINFEKMTVENTTATIAGSGVIYIDTNVANCSSWDIDKLNNSGGITSTFLNTSLKRMWLRNFSGVQQFGDSDTIASANTIAQQLVVTEAGNDADAGISIITANNKLGSVLFGDTDSSSQGGLTYSNTSDNLQIKAAGATRLTMEGDGTLTPAVSGTPTLGTAAARFGNAYIHRASLTDGIAEPGTVSGQAFIYVDSADGDLKVKFGDGFIVVLAADS